MSIERLWVAAIACSTDRDSCECSNCGQSAQHHVNRQILCSDRRSYKPRCQTVSRLCQKPESLQSGYRQTGLPHGCQLSIPVVSGHSDRVKICLDASQCCNVHPYQLSEMSLLQCIDVALCHCLHPAERLRLLTGHVGESLPVLLSALSMTRLTCSNEAAIDVEIFNQSCIFPHSLLWSCPHAEL